MSILKILKNIMITAQEVAGLDPAEFKNESPA